MNNSPKITLGFVSKYCAGKGTAISYLVDKYDFYASSCSDRIREEVSKIGQEINRENLQGMGGKLRQEFGPAVLAEKTWNHILEKNVEKAAVDSIRGVGEVEFLKKLPNFYLVALDADPKVRFERMIERTKLTGRKDLQTFEEFVKSEERDLTGDGRNILGCIEMADFKIENNGTLEELQQKIDEILKKINESTD